MLNVRKVFISLFTALSLSTPALAAGVEMGVFDNNNSATINGVAINPSGRISVSVFNIGKTASDAENMVTDSVVFVNQITPESDKSFRLPINMSNYGTGEYTLSVYQEGNKIAEKVFPFAKAMDNEASLSELNSVIDSAKTSGNADLVAQFIQAVHTDSGIKNRIRLECSSDYDLTVSIANAGKYITEQGPYASKEACVQAYRKSMLIAAFVENKISDIEDVKQNIEIFNQSPVKEVLEKAYVTETVKSNLPGKISALAPYSSVEAFNNAIKDALVLTVVNYPTGSGDILSVISAIYPDFPQKLLTPAVCRAVSNKSYASMDLLRADMERAAKANADNNNNNNNNNNNRPGGGGGGGGAPMKPSTSAVPDDTVITPGNPTVTPGIPSATGGFADIVNVSWAEEAINSLAGKGVISGRENNKFCPEDNITREEFVKMCVVLFKIPTNNDISLKFTDVASDSWYYPYIKAAYGAGIINGTSENGFGVGSQITRQDAAVIINNCIKEYNLKTEEKEAFTDFDLISDYAKEAVETMQKLGIISGYENGNFRPVNNITRAEAAKMLFSTDERIEEI